MKTKRKISRGKKKRTIRKPNEILKKQKKLVLTMLRELKWPRTERPNVLRKSHMDRVGERGGYEGFALGIVTSWAGKGKLKGYKKISQRINRAL